MLRKLFLVVLFIILFLDLIIFVTEISRFSSESNDKEICKESEVVIKALAKIEKSRDKKCPSPISVQPKLLKCPVHYCLQTERANVIGSLREYKAFLGVGVIGKGGGHEADSLIQTVSSIVQSYNNSQHKIDVLIVVLIGSVFGENKQAVTDRVHKHFTAEIQHGLIQIVTPPDDYYTHIDFITPSTEGWPQEKWTKEFSEYSSRLSLDLAYMYRYLHDKVIYTWVITGDQFVKPYVIEEMEEALRDSEVNKSPESKDWYGIHVSSPGYVIGKILRSAECIQMAEYLENFHRWQPPGEIIANLYFQRYSRIMKKFSRDKADLIPLKYRSDNPPAVITTTFGSHGGYTALQAYNRTGTFQIGPTTKGATLNIEFLSAINISQVIIITGTPLLQDMVTHAQVEISSGSISQSNGNVTAQRTADCESAGFKKLEDFQNGRVIIKDLHLTLQHPVKCLRISLTEKTKHWLHIRDIAVWKI